MSDPLYLSLWFPSFEPEEMLARSLSVLRQFRFSAAEPGIRYVSVQPIDWSEASVLEQRFMPPATPEEAADAVAEFTAADYAIVFEAYWDLWAPDERGKWDVKPNKVLFIVNGTEFDEGAYEQVGHVQVDFGPDFAFLHDETEMSVEAQEKVKANVAKLIDFTHQVEKNSNLSGRVLWSESSENLAQKLIARLQDVQ